MFLKTFLAADITGECFESLLTHAAYLVLVLHAEGPNDFAGLHHENSIVEIPRSCCGDLGKIE